MLNRLKELILGVREVETMVVSRKRSADRETFTVTFQEIGGEQTFTHTFQAYLFGRSTPKPMPGTKAILHVTRRGKIIYAGDS